jgi:hypothetical protein
MSATLPRPVRAAPASLPRPLWLLAWVAGIAILAELLHVAMGHGLVNYDSVYALVWGRDLGQGHLPDYGVALAPTPHPLAILAGLVVSPLSTHSAHGVHGTAAADAAVAGAFVALALLGWVVFRLGSLWFNWPAGLLAAALVLTRQPILDYGSRVYVDVPYLVLVLAALLVETKRPRAGWPVLALLALAGLIRPEAWAFAGLYWLWLAWPLAASRRAGAGPAPGTPSVSDLAWLALLAASAPLLWVASDWAVTGHPFWSLTSTRHTAQTLARVTGIRNVPQYIPRRIGEITRPPVLIGAAVGGVLTLWWLPGRARLGAAVGVASVVVFGVLAAAGLPINTRYAFLPATILCLFCGAGVFGWMLLPAADLRRRRAWMGAGGVVALALIAFVPNQVHLLRSLRHTLAAQRSIQNDLSTLVRRGVVGRACEPVAVPNHRPVPLMALWLDAEPKAIVSAQETAVRRGSYIAPATAQARDLFILDKRDPVKVVPRVPTAFRFVGADRSWKVYASCP